MDAVIAKIAEEWPLLAFFILVIILDGRREEKRVENAKELREQSQEHERLMASMTANNIKVLVNTINQSHTEITASLARHEAENQERYKRTNITQELIDAIAAATKKGEL